MKTNIKTLLLALFAGLTAGCSDICDCFHGSGDLVTEERKLTEITRLDLKNNIDVIIYPDTFYRMRVTAGSKLIEKIETSVNDGCLYIRNNNRCNWVRSFNPELTVEIWVKELNNIYVNGSDGNITFTDTLDSYNFRLDSYDSQGVYDIILNSYIATLALHTGPADLHASGSALVQYNFNAGQGKMTCEKLLSEKVFMNNKGTNDVFVKSSDLIEARIESEGNIYYTGNPSKVKSEISGSGKLIKY